MGVIYLATNMLNDKVYIGLTKKTLKYRKNKHYVAAKSYKKIGRNLYHFQRALLKYPKEAFEWITLIDMPNATEEELKQKEIEVIALFKANGYTLYNETNGGDGFFGNHREDTKRKLSIKNAKKVYMLLSPNKELTAITNMRKFCRDNGYGHGHMFAVLCGKRKMAYGWTLPKVQE